MVLRVVVQETARHRSVYIVRHALDENVSADTAEQCGERVSDEVEEWCDDGKVISCERVPATEDKIFVREEYGSATSLKWKAGENESCIRTEYPMQVTLVLRLLEEAGYKEVSLQDWDRK